LNLYLCQGNSFEKNVEFEEKPNVYFSFNPIQLLNVDAAIRLSLIYYDVYQDSLFCFNPYTLFSFQTNKTIVRHARVPQMLSDDEKKMKYVSFLEINC
jgi:hypothetical protein